MRRHGPFPGSGIGSGHRPLEALPPPELMENKIAAQVAEIERLRRENQRLAVTHVALREDLVGTQQEIQRFQAQIGSTQTESDIQIRMLLEKIKKMEVDLREGESLKKELQQARGEAQSLIATRQELASEIQHATKELQKAHVEVAGLPELHAELKNLRQDHQRLRSAFESEKGANMEKVEQLRAREKNLVSMVREVEKLRAEVLNAEKRAYAPYPHGAAYSNRDSSNPPPVQDGGLYMDGFGRPQIQMDGGIAGNGINPYGSTTASNNRGGAAAAVESGGYGIAANSGSGGAWGGSYVL